MFNKLLIYTTVINLCTVNCFGVSLDSYQQNMLFSHNTINKNITNCDMYSNIMEEGEFISQEKKDKIVLKQVKNVFEQNQTVPQDSSFDESMNNDDGFPNNDQNNLNNIQYNDNNNIPPHDVSNTDDNLFNMNIEENSNYFEKYLEKIKNDGLQSLNDKLMDEETDNIIKTWYSNNIYLIGDNILQEAKNILCFPKAINKLLMKFNKMNLNDMENLIEKDQNIIHSYNLLWHIIDVNKNNELLQEFNFQAIYFDTQFKNAELLIFLPNNEKIYVTVQIKPNILLDRITYTFTNNNDIALSNLINLIYLCNNTSSRKQLLLNTFKDFISTIINNEHITNNKETFLQNFNYFIQHIKPDVCNTLQNYLIKNKNKRKEKHAIFDDIIERINNNLSINNLTNKWDVIFGCIFNNISPDINTEDLIKNKTTIVAILNSNYTPIQCKTDILRSLLNIEIQHYNSPLFKEFVPLFNKNNTFLLHNIIHNEYTQNNNSIDRSTALQFNIDNAILNLSLQNKKYITELFKVFENDNYSTRTLATIRHIIYQLLGNNTDEIVTNISEVSNDTIYQLFINTMEQELNDNNQLNAVLRNRLEELLEKFKLLTNNKYIKDQLNKNMNLNINLIQVIFQSPYHIKTLVDFMNTNYNNRYTETIVSNIIHFATINNVINNNSEYKQNFDQHFISELNINVLKLVDRLIDQHMQNIDKETGIQSYKRHEALKNIFRNILQMQN